MSDADIAARTGNNSDFIMGTVSPGTYKARITSGNKSIEKTFTVLKDHWVK